MRRRTLLGLIGAAPLAALIGCREAQAADLSGLGDPSIVGSRAWYIQRLYDSAAAGAAICTRDNGALFDYCQRAHRVRLLEDPTWFPNLRDPVTGRDRVTNTEHYIYWPMSRSPARRDIVLSGLKQAAALDDSFGRRATFVQPATRHI